MFIPATYFFYPETANRTLEDIDRFFEMKPGLLVHRNQLATQLSRPELYIEADERITGAEMESKGDVEKVGLERVEEAEETKEM